MLGLTCSLGFSLVEESRGSSNCDVQAFIEGASFAPEHKLWRLRLQYRLPPGSRAQFQWFWPMGSVAPWLVGSSQTRDQTHVSCIGRQILNHWITRGALFFIFLLEYNCFFFFLVGRCRASLIAQSVKNLPAMQGTQVRFLGRADPLQKEMATHSSILAWRILWMEEPGRLQSMGSQELNRT